MKCRQQVSGELRRDLVLVDAGETLFVTGREGDLSIQRRHFERSAVPSLLD
jgi:hypothetical protein